MSDTDFTQDEGSGAPSGFANAAPFKKKARKKDPGGTALMAVGFLGIGLCFIAVVMSMI